MLIDGKPLTSAVSLRAAGNGDFRTKISDFAQAALRDVLRPEEIVAEALAQMRRVQSAGLELTHFDTHKHTHMFPKVLRPLLRAAREAGVKAVRNPFAPLKALGWAHLVRRPKLWVRYSEVNILRRYAERFHCEVKSAGLKTTNGTFGVIVTGALDERLFAAIVGSIPEGTWEFVCHPGYNDAALGLVNTRLRASRQAELRVLTSPEAARLLQKHDIELVTFAGL
jgi:chitin disaccharide deacetylase